MSILVVCNDPECDQGIGLVGAALKRRGIDLVALRADRFPVEQRLGVLLETHGDRIVGPMFDGVNSIWLRHTDPGGALPEHIRPDLADAIRQQAAATLSTLMEASGLPVFDPPNVLARAPEKPRQLAIARALGLRTPRTLVTNDIAALRDFAASCGQGVISKMVESVRVHALADGAEIGGFTRAVTEDDLVEEASLALCPMVFQEKVEKVRDLRVTVVGDRLFCAAVRAGDVLDWRSDPALIAGFRPTELPPEVARAVLAYCDRIGVQLAGFDFVEDARGELTFIEANTLSFFHFVERSANLPISDAIADLLTGTCAPRRSPCA